LQESRIQKQKLAEAEKVAFEAKKATLLAEKRAKDSADQLKK